MQNHPRIIQKICRLVTTPKTSTDKKALIRQWRRIHRKRIHAKSGIIHETTPPHTPEYNGITERYNRTLQEGALTLQHESNLSKKFWVTTIHTVNFVRTQVLHARIGKSPYQAFWGTKLNIDWLRTFSCKCWPLVPKVKWRKGDFRSI